MTVVAVKALEKTFGSGRRSWRSARGRGVPRRQVSVGPVSFDLEPGTFVALVGRSGSGKSTVLNCVAGLTRPSSGSVVLAGVETTQLSDQQLAKLRREMFGFVYQDYTLIDMLTASENITLPARMSHRTIRAGAVAGLARRLGLENRLGSTIDELSGGERQRVAIARAVANDARVIFADEPTGALDPITRDEVMDLLLGALRDGGSPVESVLMATHDIELAARADQVIVMADGVPVEALHRPDAQGVLDALLRGSGEMA